MVGQSSKNTRTQTPSSEGKSRASIHQAASSPARIPYFYYNVLIIDLDNIEMQSDAGNAFPIASIRVYSNVRTVSDVAATGKLGTGCLIRVAS